MVDGILSGNIVQGTVNEEYSHTMEETAVAEVINENDVGVEVNHSTVVTEVRFANSEVFH